MPDSWQSAAGLGTGWRSFFPLATVRRYVYWRHANSLLEIVMNIRTAIILAAPLALALAGCGRSDNASTEAEADTVEIPANEALNGVNDLPVADPNANATVPAADATPGPTEAEQIQAAGDTAADTAAAAADAMNETTTQANQTQGQ